MLSALQRTHLCETFKSLPKLERQIIALKIICCQHNDEHKLIGCVQAMELTDDKGAKFTHTAYRVLVLLLDKLGFLHNKNTFTIHPELHHDLLILMSEEDMASVYPMVDQLYQFDHTYYYDRRPPKERAYLVRSIYENHPGNFVAHFDELGYCNRLLLDLREIFGSSVINLDWLQSRHKLIRQYICVALLSHYYCDSKPSRDSMNIFDVFSKHTDDDVQHDFLQYYSAIIHLSAGNFDAAKTYCARIHEEHSGYALALQATFSFVDGQFNAASKLYRKALTAIRKKSDIRSYYFDNILGVFHAFCIAYVDKNFKQLETNALNYNKYSDATWAMPMGMTYWLFPIIPLIEVGHQKAAQRELQSLEKELDPFSHPLMIALHQLLWYMSNKHHLHEQQDELYKQLQLSIQNNQQLATLLLYELLANTDKYQLEANAFLESTSIPLRLLTFIHVKENWEYSFQALENLLLEGAQAPGAPVKSKRLMWLVDPDRQEVDVVEQSLSKSGQWSRGRSVSLNKLKHYLNEPNFDYLTPQDKLVIGGITEEGDGWRGFYYDFSSYHCLLALVGHPHIVHYQNRDVSIELVRGEPELHIEENKQGYHLSLSHFLPDAGLIIEPESMNKYRVIDFSSAFAAIGQVISKKGLTIPASAKDKVLKVIQHAKRDIKIHAGIQDMDIPEIAGDAAPCLQILPTNTGIRATLWAKPLAHHGAYFKLTQGKESFMTLISENGVEKRTRVQRNFQAEKKNQNLLFSQCPSLSQHEYDPGEYEIESPEDVLEVLSELQQFATTQPLNIEWPQGQTFKIKQRVTASNLSLKISSENSWFEYDGKLTLDDGEVLGMQELLESLNTSTHGRFVRLGNGEFIELTSQLKKQLTLLHALSDDQKINPLGAQALSDIVAQVENTTFDAGWTAHLKKVKKMRNHAPEVPSTLQATLRDYQTEGFQYLSRLTHWGIGACLADDMGLGKTVQTISLLLERAKNGASLVVAPTSVSFNWIEELHKFAPTLNVYDLRSEDRVALIEKAGAFDVIICSYGLLQHNGDLLTDKKWETIVLDEAQAIKNAQTQRWKTVMKLKGKSRIALSGTPIENHLGELWSIFSFINPGLLGSIKHFQDKYSTPIETKQAPDKIHALRALVQPYILRRIKSDVLKELPPKTEQTIHVEPTEQEATFYEALRRTAAERMAHFMAENNRISVLAEITKLRQACCDSSLVDSSVNLDNSKLNAFIETVKNIIENGHKALVFSQYVSFLSIVRQRIEAEKIEYQYLDGSTSAGLRKKSVEAFQNGEGDLFLLSLKAGGSGLNLTAADYVIHLDPWWNPAVEDQASDRAHRIGQERPVTIYRFVMRNTIEEKIIALHEHKRNLANELLSGQGVSGKLSNDDLMNLISKGVLEHSI